MPVLFANNIASTLSAGIINTDTTIPVASATGMPTTGWFYALIDSEIVLITAVSGTNLTAVRGQEGTTAASHSSGAALTLLVTVAGLRALKTDGLLSQTYIEDDFIGVNVSGGNANSQLQWLLTNGAMQAIDGAANHPGILQNSTSASNGTISQLNLRGRELSSADTFDFLFVINPVTVDANTILRIGMMPTAQWANNPPTDGIYFEKLAADTNFFACARAGSVSTRTDMGVAVSAAWHAFRIRRIDSTHIGFIIDNGTEVVLASGLPATAIMGVGHQTSNTAAASKVVWTDYFRMALTGLVRF